MRASPVRRRLGLLLAATLIGASVNAQDQPGIDFFRSLTESDLPDPDPNEMLRVIAQTVVAGAAVETGRRILSRAELEAQNALVEGVLPNRPILVVGSDAQDARIEATREAAEFWNALFADMSLEPPFSVVGFRLDAGPPPEADPDPTQRGAVLVVALLDTPDLSGETPPQVVSTGGPDRVRLSPGYSPNVLPNVVAHELGHSLGLDHTDDPATLMCGRPAPCRPTMWEDVEGYLPLSPGSIEALRAAFDPAYLDRVRLARRAHQLGVFILRNGSPMPFVPVGGTYVFADDFTLRADSNVIDAMGHVVVRLYEQASPAEWRGVLVSSMRADQLSIGEGFSIPEPE